MIRPEKLPSGGSFMLFQDNIEPKWEHKANKNGGTFYLKIKKKYINKFWEDLALGFIGEQCEENDNICGMIVKAKMQDCVINVWIKETSKEKQKKIQDWIIRALHLNDNTQIDMFEHPKEGQPNPEELRREEKKD